ncbi:hypothetical protein BOX15_Mlig014589g1, partial [Macrostomum lignano]
LKTIFIMIDFSNADALNLDAALDATVEDIDDIFNNSLFDSSTCHNGNCNGVAFRCFEESELHYSLCHRHACEACHQAFPNHRLLDCHIQAAHSGPLCKLFSCVLPVCDEKFPNPSLAKEHAIREHKFPSNYRFFPPTKESPNRPLDVRKRPTLLFHSKTSRHQQSTDTKCTLTGNSATATGSEPMETE